MRISLGWLRELVDVEMSPESLAELLTMAGFEVEDIEDRRTWAEGVVVGKVLQCDPHPNADKLRVCQVDIGADEPSGIVCGAANVRVDALVPVATVGTYLPTVDLKIKPRKLRSVPSAGMICSLSELGLEKESEGIHIFTDAALTPGEDVRPLLGLDDVVFDLTSTANRADALSMVGIAREVAALTGKSLKLPEIPTVDLSEDPKALSLSISNPEACPIYLGTVIEQVAIAPSPPWLQRRLQAAGTRPINNVVDITNYVLLEWGQPLHAFDRDRLITVAGQKSLSIGVRYAQTEESLKTLDGQSRTLTEQNLLITANDKPVALAGVMGGEETEVHDATENLVLEAALFDSAAIRRSARAQGLRTEASSRYERGVNPAELAIASRRALQLIQELAGGKLSSQAVADARPADAVSTRTLSLRLERVNQVLGPVKSPDGQSTQSLTEADVERTLTALGCEVTKTKPGQWTVIVPPYRARDLEREIDLIEEVARLYGYNQFCDTLPGKTAAGSLSPAQSATRKLAIACRAVGLTEAIHYSLVKPTGSEDQITLANPLLAEYAALRTELLSGLIDACQYNIEQGNGVLNAFEIGRIFWRTGDSFQESDRLAGVMGGDPRQTRWTSSGQETPMTWYEAKGILDSVFERVGLSPSYSAGRRDPWLHPGRTALLSLNGQDLGTFGQLHPQLRQERGLPDAVYGFELDLSAIQAAMTQEALMTPLLKPFSTYPASDRDIAFFAPTDLTVAAIEQVVQKAGGKLLESVALFDDYRGKNVPEGKRSLAFRLIYRAGDRTLKDNEVEEAHQKVRDALVKKLGVEPRS